MGPELKKRGLLFVGTGNTYEPPAAPMSDSLVALDAATLSQEVPGALWLAVRPMLHFDQRSLLYALPEPAQWFWGVFRRNLWIFNWALAGTVALNIFGALIPFYSMAVYDRVIPNNALGSLGVLSVAFWALSTLAVTGAALVIGALAVVVWGASAAALPPMLQTAAIRTCVEQPERASALYVTAFQIGILLGSVNGGLVYGHFGLAAVVATSAVLFAVTLAGVLWRRDTFPV